MSRPTEAVLSSMETLTASVLPRSDYCRSSPVSL